MIRSILTTLVLLSALPSQADQVKYLGRPEEALSAFSSLISSAKKSIDIATYIYEPCDSSVQVLVGELRDRVRAGVKVRVLLDAFEQSNAQKQNIIEGFAGTGIELRFFDYSSADIDTRMHNKFTIVDDQAYIAGGRNLSDAYFVLSTDYNYVDRDVLVRGHAAHEATTAFNELWASEKVVKPVSNGTPFSPWSQFCGRDVQTPANRLKAFLNGSAQSILSNAPLRECASVHFVDDHDDYADASYGPGWSSGKKDGTFLTNARLERKVTTKTVLEFVEQARRRLSFVNYAYMPIYDLEAAFTRARESGVEVAGLSNSDLEPAHPSIVSDAQEYAIATIASRDSDASERTSLISAHGSLGQWFTLSPKGTLFYIHAKTMTRDGRDALVSSFNLDSRSANINIEAATVILDCPQLVADIDTRDVEIAAQLKADQALPVPPAPPEVSALAKIFAAIGITEF